MLKGGPKKNPRSHLQVHTHNPAWTTHFQVPLQPLMDMPTVPRYLPPGCLTCTLIKNHNRAHGVWHAALVYEALVPTVRRLIITAKQALTSERTEPRVSGSEAACSHANGWAAFRPRASVPRHLPPLTFVRLAGPAGIGAVTSSSQMSFHPTGNTH